MSEENQKESPAPASKSGGSSPNRDHHSVERELRRTESDAARLQQYRGDILRPFADADNRRFHSETTCDLIEQANARLIGAKSMNRTGSLVDAWYGSFGTAGSRATMLSAADRTIADLMNDVIIGVDDRIKVARTNEYPFSALCFLEITASNGRTFVGTGWLVDPITVVTAGHCVYSQNEGGWARAIKVYPGDRAADREAAIFGRSLMSVSGWVDDASPGCDYGAIRLQQPIDNIGTIGFRTGSDEELLCLNCHVVGFPVDKPQQMWGQLRRLTEVQAGTLIYDIDAYGGMSGSPVMVVEDGEVLAIGIHTAGDLSGNVALRITDHVFDNLEMWKSES